MKRNVAATAASPKRRSRNMKPIRQPKTAAPEPLKSRSFVETFAESFSSDGFQWPPVEVPRSLRPRTVVDTTLPRWQSVKPHAVLGVNMAICPRGNTGLRPRRPVPFPLSRVPSSNLSGVLQALGTDSPAAVGTPAGTLVTKIQSTDSSAFAAVDSTPSVIQVQKFQMLLGANTQLQLQQNVKLHPVLGFFVRTRRRGCRCPCPCSAQSPVPKLLSLFPGGNCENYVSAWVLGRRGWGS